MFAPSHRGIQPRCQSDLNHLQIKEEEHVILAAHNLQETQAVEFTTQSPCRTCSFHGIQKPMFSRILNLQESHLVKDASHYPSQVWQGHKESFTTEEGPPQVEKAHEDLKKPLTT